MYIAQSYDAHYEPGFARIDGYSADTSGQTLVLSTPVGAGDLLLGHDLKETSDSVIVTVHSSVYVPGRNGFKNLSATLDTTRVVLTQPLGTRRVIDGATGRTVARSPSAPPSLTPSPNAEQPVLVASMPIGQAGTPTVRHEGTGGAGWDGPRTFAVDDAGDIWVWDGLALRLFRYDARGMLRDSFPLTASGDDGLLLGSASDLLASRGQLFLRTPPGLAPRVFVIDVLRRMLSSVVSGSAATTAYPRERVGGATGGKDAVTTLGSDLDGNTYRVTSACAGCLEFQRVRGGVITAVSRTSTPAVADYYLDERGAIYELAWSPATDAPQQLLVNRILAPARP